MVEALRTLPQKSNPSDTEILRLKNYFCKKNQTLASILGRIEQIKCWQGILSQCLPEEKTLFAHCHVVQATPSHLMIVTENPHWNTRLRFLVPQILQQLKQQSEHAKLTAIYCKVRPPLFHPSLTFKKKHRVPLIISQNTATALKRAADKIQNKKVRCALEKLAAHAGEME